MMFRWKKDKEKDDKKKKEKKEKNQRKPLTEKEHQEDLKRQEEERKNFISHVSDRQDDEGSEKQSNSSDYSLSSAADSSPSGGSITQLDPNKIGSPTKQPPPIPQKPILRVKPNQAGQGKVQTTPSPQGSTYSMVSLHLGASNLTNEMMELMDQMNQGGTRKSPDAREKSLSPTKPCVPPTPPSQVPAGEQGGYGVRWKSYALDLRLPPVAALKPPKIRTLTIQRQPSEDFGISLRRVAILDRHSMQGEVMQHVVFAEPSNTSRSDTGLLPGDRLLEVNEVSIENKPSEKIRELIRSLGDYVVLKVQQVPELRELNNRQDSDSTDAEASGSSIFRSNSRRFKNVAKSEQQVEIEKNWLQTEIVWVVHKGGFSAAHRVKSGPQPPEGKVRVKLEFTGDELEVDEEDVEKVNPPQFDYVENITHLRHVNESNLLHTLRQRYSSRLIYTYAGNNLLVLNPARPLAAYSEKIMKMFKSLKNNDMPPHIYAVAQTALNNLLRTRKDQAILFSGRSGSGKTVSFRHVLQYFVTVASSSKQILSGEKLNAIFTLLDAFGNGRTSLNGNATRFTQLFTLDCDHSGQIVSASVQAYMLEKARVCRRPEGEPNFNIFYQFLAGVDDILKKELFLEDLQEVNMFMSPLHKEEDKKRASSAWTHVIAAMRTLSVQTYESKAIWCILAAIYHLGVASSCRGSNGRLHFLKPQSAQKAASLLGTTVEDLAKCVFASDQNYPVSGRARSGDGVSEASDCLQAMVTGLYNEAFNVIIYFINRTLCGTGRSTASIHVLDCPGFQNPATCGRIMGASLEDLCHNYCQERYQALFHETTFLTQQERYMQENIDWNKEEFHIPSPSTLVDVIDHTPQQGALRASSTDLREAGRRGLLWLLDEESLFPGATEKSLLDKVFTHYSGKDYQQLVRKGPYNHQFTIQHFQGTNPVVYSVSGWVKTSREHPVFKQAALFLHDSQKECISQLFASSRGFAPSASGGMLSAENTSTLRRSSSMRRAQSVASSGVKRRSLPLQVKYTMDGIIDMLKRTNLHFVFCFLPQHNSASGESRTPNKTSTADELLNIPLLRSQLRGAQILDMVRVHKQGFPENLMYSEFRRRFEILVPPEHRIPTPIYDERQAVEDLLEHMDIAKPSYRLGLSQIFLRSGTLSSLEMHRDEKLNDVIISFQAHCREWLAKSAASNRQKQDKAIRCIQKNVRNFLAIRSWSWWRLYIKVLPLLNVHRTEEELKQKSEELEAVKMKLEKAEKDRGELKKVNENLEAKVAELRSDLLHEQSSSTHTSEVLESETTERMRLEKEVSELQSRYNHVQKKSNKMEMKMMEARVYRSPEINGDISDDDEGNASLYKQKYEKAVQDMEIMKRRVQQQREEEMEQNLLTRKAADKKLAEALEDVEEEKQVANQWKRKAQKLGSELQDLRLMLEEQMARNGELEKKQRGFDAELHSHKEEIKKERMLREKALRERDQAQNEKFSLEQELHTTRLDMDEKVILLKQELDELTLSSKGEEEVTLLKRAKQELERKYRDLEEELEEYVDKSNMLETAKVRLEMSLEKLRQEHRRESSVREEEIEELRASFSKKIKNLEAQVESEQEERHQLVKQKHELERRVIELTDQPPPQDPEIERRLRRDLKRTKALLRDAQAMLDRVRDGQGSKSVVRQLKNQLEDVEFAKCSAIKAKQAAEMELQDLQTQLEEVTRNKNDHESRCLQLSREKSALQTQVEEAEEETTEVMNKYEALVARMSTDQKTIAELNQQIADLEAEKNALRDQLSEVNTKFEHLAGQTEDSHRTFKLDAKVRDLDSKLELEQTSRTRLEHQITRLKEQIERLQEECDSLRNKELQAQESTRRFQRQVRDLREDYSALQQKEAEAYRKQHELETALESAEGELKVAKNDLRLACQRIEELKNALEDDLDSGTDVPDDSGSDSDSSLDMSTMMRSSFTPIQRCDSAASDLSFGSRRSVTPSYGDLAALCRGMWRRTSMDFLT